MDAFEKLLADLVADMTAAWIKVENHGSPLGELTARAAALLQFYREREPRLPPKVDSRGDTGWGKHWTDE